MWDLNDMNNVKNKNCGARGYTHAQVANLFLPAPIPFNHLCMHYRQWLPLLLVLMTRVHLDLNKKGGGIIRSCVKMSSAKERQIYV